MPIKHVEKQEEGAEEESKFSVIDDADRHMDKWDERARLSVVGKPLSRVEGAEKVTGRARYSYDIHLPGQLYGRILRSNMPHARVLSVDTAAAEALPGVHAVLTREDAPDMKWFEESKLFDETVRYIGDEIAAVAAETEEIAEDAIRLIRVEYELLPYFTEIESALAPGAPKIHEDGNVAGEPKKYSRGDTEAGFLQADVIIDQVYITSSALHNSLEPHGSTASWEGDELTLWSSTQGIWAVRETVAERLEIPQANVRVIKNHMGGGFGAKQIAWKPDVIAALLSKKSGRPVQVMLDRESENLAAGNRNATIQHVRIGAKRDGTLTAIEADVKTQNGAYMTGGEAADVAGIYQTLYLCPNVTTDMTSVYTNTGPAVAFRAPGHVEGAWGLEAAMDELALELGIDPIELRMRNYANDNQSEGKPYSSPDALRLCYESASEAFGWVGHKQPAPSGPKRRGVGFAAHDWMGGGGHPPGYAWIKINSDGSIDLITGTQDIGTGTRTGLLQVAAEELGVPIESIRISIGDTARGPYSPVSSGSATQSTVGPAIRSAAIDAKRQLLEAAAPMLESRPEQLYVENGQICVFGGAKSITIAEVTKNIAPNMIQALGSRGENPKGVSIRTCGAQIVEVEVDTETGEVTVLRVIAAHDAGRIINPKMVESQIIGGVTQGIGYALTEERMVDMRTGIVLNANLEEYKVPTVADIPAIIHAGIDLPDTVANPTGAKGVGEPPLIPTAPAIANAIYDAVGIRVRTQPLSRHRILKALSRAAEAQQEKDQEARDAAI